MPGSNICYSASGQAGRRVISYMKYPIELKPETGKLLCKLATGIQVREQGGLRWMHFGGDAIQAMLVLGDPVRPIIPYQINMLVALLLNPDPGSLLNLGLGGGSFERFFSAFMPVLSLTSVELNPDVIQLQRDYFSIPGSASVIQSDAGSYLSSCAESYDVILCDIFEQTDIPSSLGQDSFYADAFRLLTTNGVLAINLLPHTEAELLNILLAVRSSFDHLLLLDLPDFKNILLFCLKQDPPGPSQLEQRAEALITNTGIDLSHVAGCIRVLPKPHR